MSATVENIPDPSDPIEQPVKAAIASTRAGKRRTKPEVLLAHIHAAYQGLQVSLTSLAQNTRSQEHKVSIGAAQQELDGWRLRHWSKITEPSRNSRKV